MTLFIILTIFAFVILIYSIAEDIRKKIGKHEQ